MSAKLIIGLGNPGEQYAKTRHNAGFITLNAFAEKNDLSQWSMKDRFKSEIIEFTDESGDKIVLAKPQTFMNLSGEAVQALKQFYKVDNEDITVVHDELDLPSEEVRTKQGGGSAGHNGIESVASHIGPDFNRVRIGIRTPEAESIEATDFVLGRLSKDEILQIRSLEMDKLLYG